MPWGRLDDSLYDHPKLDRIPAEERLAAVGLWARSISWCNRFLTDGHVPRGRIERLDGSLELAGRLVASGLFEETGDGFLVHDFLEFNDSRADVEERRKKETERQREWRKKKAELKAESRNGVSHGVTANGSEPDVTPSVTPSVTASVTPSSRARDVARIPARPGPARPSESLEREDRRAPARTRRADIQALHDRGWTKVTKAQRAVLDEILGRHDVTGPEFAASAIRATPADRDPLEAAMEADRLWQAAQRRQADADEQAAEADRISWLEGPSS